MSHREVKRPYAGSQPHITSYFPAQPTTSDSQSQPTYSITQPSSSNDSEATHAIPHSVQSSLLNVGMRVRKSVPEGYKTGSEYSAFSLFQQSKSLPATPTAPAIMASSPPTRTRPRANAGPRELMPFCGLLKVGGLGAQQGWGIYSPTHETRNWTKYDCHSVDVTPEEEEVPALSQGSTLSSGSGRESPSRNKRRCDWDDSEDDEIAEEDVFRIPNAVEQRPIAVPRRKKVAVREGTKVFGDGSGDIDFGEADFLDFGGFQGSKGMEVEMGGV